MKDIDKSGAVWEVDNGLKDRARQLQKDEDYIDLISHVDLDQVIFARISNTKAKWMGKCYYFGKAPLTLVSKYIIGFLAQNSMLNISAVANVDEDLFDLRYFIVLNDDKLNMVQDNPDQVEDLTLVHELMHIDPSGDKLVKHDLEDFSVLVNRFGPYWTAGAIADMAMEESD